MANDTPAGWYPAPDASDLLRYWDGEMWTESARPAPAGRAGPATGLSGRPTLKVQRSEAVARELDEGEMVEAGFHSSVPYRPMMFVATSSRLLIFDPEGLRRRYRIFEYGFDQVEAVGYSNFTGTNLTVDGVTWQCSPMDTTATSDFIAYVRSRIPRSGPIDLANLPAPKLDDAADADTSAPQSPPSGGSTTDTDDSIAGQILRLAELHSDGILSDEEFIAAKARVIADGG